MNKNIIEQLEKLGLSQQDAEVYLALLKIGQGNAGKVIEETGYHREIVYSALGRLEREGLVSWVEKKRVRHYTASEPKVLVSKVLEKAEVARELLPRLESIFTEVPTSVRIYEGVEGYEEIQKDIQNSLKDGESFHVIGGSGSGWYKVAESFWRKYQKKLIKRKIKMMTVTSKSEAESIAHYEIPELNPIRVMPADFTSPSSTLVYKDRVIIQVFGESPMAIMIKSQAISEAYQKYFDTLWNISEEFNYADSRRG